MIGQDPGVSTAGVLEPRRAELPAERHRDAGGRSAGADSAAERRLLRGSDVHRRSSAGAGAELDGRLDVVSAELMFEAE